MKQFYVYLTTNLINNKKYIGQHYGEINDSYLGSGHIILDAIKKYGKENFKKEILKICKDYEDLNNSEKYFIKEYNAVKDPMFYNIATGGFGSNPCAGLSPEAAQSRKEKLSNAAKGEKNHFYGKHHSEESKEKMRQAKLGGKAPTAKRVAIYDLNGNFIKNFETQRAFKIFLGLSPNGSTETLSRHILEEKPYHGYIVKYIE